MRSNLIGLMLLAGAPWAMAGPDASTLQGITKTDTLTCSLATGCKALDVQVRVDGSGQCWAIFPYKAVAVTGRAPSGGAVTWTIKVKAGQDPERFAFDPNAGIDIDASSGGGVSRGQVWALVGLDGSGGKTFTWNLKSGAPSVPVGAGFAFKAKVLDKSKPGTTCTPYDPVIGND